MFKSALVSLLLASSAALAMEPLVAIDRQDPDYNYYASILSPSRDMVKSGLVLEGVAYWDNFATVGRIAAINDGTYEYPYNLVLNVNGNLYYVDAILSRVLADENGVRFKIRRRWKNNPEPGVFIRVAATRFNPVQSIDEYTQLWIKIAEVDGKSIPVLKVIEGNFDE